MRTSSMFNSICRYFTSKWQKPKLQISLKSSRFLSSNSSPSTFESFTEESSIHGVRFLSKNKNHKFSRIFWSLSLIVSLIGLSYNAKRLYFKLNISPDIGLSVKHQLAREVPFPAITICIPLFAKNGLANYTHYMEEFTKNGHKNILNLTESERKQLAVNILRCPTTKVDSVVKCCQKTNITNIVNIMNEASLLIHEALESCSLTFKTTDCRSMFKTTLTELGFCFTTNMQHFDTIFNRNTLSDDFTFLIKQQTLNSITKFDNYVDWSLDKGYESQTIKDGVPLRLLKSNIYSFRLFSTLEDSLNFCGFNNINIKIHPPNEIPTFFIRGFPFEHGREKRLLITAKAIYAHPSLRSYSPKARGCYFEDEKKLKFFKTYTKNHCYLECLTNYAIKRCGCAAFFMPRNSTTKVCRVDGEYCINRCVFEWPKDEHLSDGTTPCECYPTCNDIEYSAKEDDFDYDASPHADVIKNYSHELIYSRLFVHFDSHIIQKNEKFVSYKLNNFIADIGGLLGLFLGCSLLSMIEVLFFVCMALRDKYSKRRESSGLRVKTVSPLNNELLKNLSKIDDNVYIVRSPLYKRDDI